MAIMTKGRFRGVLVAALALGAAGVWLAQRSPASGQEPAAAPPPGAVATPAIPVSVAPATRRDVPLTLEGLGTVQGWNTVTIRPQVDGQLIRIAFTEGQMVRAGDLLAQIDPRTYQAALDQALAKKAQDEALLGNARADLQRYAKLAEKQFATRQQSDTAQAQVAQLEAAIKGDEAAIGNARVLLGYTSIVSPIDGRVGIRQIDQGNIVNASDPGGIVTVTQMRPLSALFTLPETTVPRVLKAMAAGPLAVTALSRDGGRRLDEGKLELIDSQVDTATGTIRLKASLPNADGLLWPGQFVTVRLLVETRRQALTVPAAAILRGQQGAYVYAVTAAGTAEARPVTVGPASQSDMVIEAGLRDGEAVVTAGHYRLQPGARVQAAPTAKAD